MKYTTKHLRIILGILLISCTFHDVNADMTLVEQVTLYHDFFSSVQVGFFLLNEALLALNELPPRIDSWLLFSGLQLFALFSLGKSQRTLWSNYPPKNNDLISDFVIDSIKGAVFAIVFYRLALLKNYEPIGSIGTSLIFAKMFCQLIPVIDKLYLEEEIPQLYEQNRNTQANFFSTKTIKALYLFFFGSWKRTLATIATIATFGIMNLRKERRLSAPAQLTDIFQTHINHTTAANLTLSHATGYPYSHSLLPTKQPTQS